LESRAAFLTLVAVGCRFRMQFIGGLLTSRYAAKFQEMIAEAKRAGFAEHVEPKSDEELLQYFDTANALVHFTSEEAFGLVVAESLARNLKLFGARVGGIPDIAEGIEMAELYDPNDWDGLFRGLASWIDGTRAHPKSAATEMEKRYSPHFIAARHLEIYEEVIQETISSAPTPRR
jgi:glycosyltransferase involved in cell wall biosynthesis